VPSISREDYDDLACDGLIIGYDDCGDYAKIIALVDGHKKNYILWLY